MAADGECHGQLLPASDGSEIDRAQIARWERDAVSPPYETLRELVRACGFDLSADLVALNASPDDVLAVTGPLTPQERLVRMLERRAMRGKA